MQIAIISIAFGAAAYAVIRLPRWLFVSVNRQSAWRIRDRIWDARLVGAVPDDETTQSVIQLAEAAVIGLPYFTPRKLNEMHRAGHLHRERDPRWPTAESDPMIWDEFQSIGNIATRAFFTNTWGGIATLVVGVLVSAAGFVWKKATRHRVHISNSMNVSVAGIAEVDATDVMSIAEDHGITQRDLVAAAV